MATELNKTTPDAAYIRCKIKRAQCAWADGVVAIGKAEDTASEAQRVLDELYDFDEDGNFILFKPTLARKVPVRVNEQQTASYFIGDLSDKPIPEDEKGFARTPWDKVTFEKDFFFTELESGDILVMGRCHFYKSDKEGSEPDTTADYTFGYRKDSMRIFLHHSSRKESKKDCEKYKDSQYI
ncbi:MAG: hypothetical protein AAFQ94_02340 [Bacteroidota bacterium]